MKNHKMYVPKDAIAQHEDFEVWYEDGSVALEIKGDWSCEKDKVTIVGPLGGEIGRIKPDNKTLTYYIKYDRYEYVFHTLRIFKRYWVEGMLWQIEGAADGKPLNFKNENTSKTDVHVQLVNYRNRGECFEVRASDVAFQRIAVAVVLSMLIKENYKGLSEGEKDSSESGLKKFMKKYVLPQKSVKYEDMCEEEDDTK